MNPPFRFLKKPPAEVIIVSGLPRSGTSMMMKMLAVGGLTILTDHLRQADDDNPQGYYEFERVKQLPGGDTGWLQEAHGKVVKIISQLLLFLPDTHQYKILFMRRDMAEVLASQHRMLERRGKHPDGSADEEMARLFAKHIEQVFAWLNGHANVSYLEVDYNQMLRDPWATLPQIGEFLAMDLDLNRMAAVIDPALYRQRNERGDLR